MAEQTNPTPENAKELSTLTDNAPVCGTSPSRPSILGTPELTAAATLYWEAVKDLADSVGEAAFPNYLITPGESDPEEILQASIKLIDLPEERDLTNLDAILVWDGWTLILDKEFFSRGRNSIDSLQVWLKKAKATTPEEDTALVRTKKKIREMKPMVDKLATEGWLANDPKVLTLDEQRTLRSAFRQTSALLELRRVELTESIQPLCRTIPDTPRPTIAHFYPERPRMPVRLFVGGKLAGLANCIRKGLGPAGLMDQAKELLDFASCMHAFHTSKLWQYSSIHPDNESIQENLHREVERVRTLLLQFLEVLLPAPENSANISLSEAVRPVLSETVSNPLSCEDKAFLFFQNDNSGSNQTEIVIENKVNNKPESEEHRENPKELITIFVKQHDSGPRFFLGQHEIKPSQRNSLHWLLKTFHDRRAKTPPFQFENSEFAELWVNRKNPSAKQKSPKSPSKYIGNALRPGKLPKSWHYPGDQLLFKKEVDEHDETIFRIVNLQFEELSQP